MEGHLKGATSEGVFTKRIKTIDRFSQKDLEEISIVEKRDYPVSAGTVLIQEGDAPKGMFIFTSGFACRIKVGKRETGHILGWILPGDICDTDGSTIDSMDYSILALSDCRVVRINPNGVSYSALQKILGNVLHATSIIEQSAMRRWLMNLSGAPAIERLAYLFCELYVRLNAVHMVNNNAFKVPVKQSYIANAIGISPVHLNRILKNLCDTGMIRYNRNIFRIIDFENLAEFAGFSSDYLFISDYRSNDCDNLAVNQNNRTDFGSGRLPKIEVTDSPPEP